MDNILLLSLIAVIFSVNKKLLGSFFSLESILPIFYLILMLLLNSGVYLQREISFITISAVMIFSSVLYFFSIALANYKGLNNLSFNICSFNRIENVTIILSVISLFYISYYIPQAAKYILIDAVGDYRKNVNGFGDDGSLLFGDGFSLFFYQFFFKGILVSLSISSSILYFVKGVKKPLYIITLVILIDCFVSFGRFIIYYHFISFIISGIFYKKINLFKLLKLSILLLLFVIGFTLFRFENFTNLYSVLIRNIIGYHIFGFSLFDEFIISNVNVIPDWMGLTFLSNFQYITQKILGIFGFDYLTFMSSEIYRGFSDFVYLGKDVFGDDVYANAFYTNLLDMYLDAGLISLFIYSCFISLIYAITLRLAKQDSFNIFKVFAFLYVFLFIYFGVFNSQMLLLRNVFSLLFLISLFVFSKKIVLRSE